MKTIKINSNKKVISFLFFTAFAIFLIGCKKDETKPSGSASGSGFSMASTGMCTVTHIISYDTTCLVNQDAHIYLELETSAYNYPYNTTYTTSNTGNVYTFNLTSWSTWSMNATCYSITYTPSQPILFKPTHGDLSFEVSYELRNRNNRNYYYSDLTTV